MRILKKMVLWYTLYGIVISLAFLYLLFPGDIVKNRIEAAAAARDVLLKAETLQPSLPVGIKLGNISASSADLRDVFFQGEKLDLQLNLLSLLQKYSSISFDGKAYGGNFDGRIGFVSWDKAYPPVNASLNFQNIDLGKYPLIKNELGRNVSGKIRGSLLFNNASESSSKTGGTLNLFLVKGSYPLTEPFLGMSRIEIDRGEIKAQLKNGILKLEKMEISGPQINCSLKGDITLADDIKNSQLNLNGMVEILGKSKIKTNITISGTLASPVSRYI
jgi:type II secretion system protein N